MLRKTIHATLIVILMMGAASAQIKDNPGFYNGAGGETADEGVKAREKKNDRAIDRAYQSKQIDNDYKAATSKIPDQKPNDPWGAIRPAPSTLNPKTPTVAGAKKKQQ
jgi:hypothetical protein